MFKRYRTELLIAAAALLVLLTGIFLQQKILNTTTSEPLATQTNYVHTVGAPLDDVFIHCRYAENLLRGYLYDFNPGAFVTADTSPFWVLLVAAGGLLTADLLHVAILLSALCYVLLAVGVYRASRDLWGLPETFAILAGSLTVLSAFLVWAGLSGMDTALACLFMFLVVEAHERNRQRNELRVREALWLGLGIATRPEFYFIGFILAADWLWLGWRQHANLRKAWTASTVTLILASPAYLLPLLSTGSFISHSSVVQGARFSFIPNIRYFVFAAKMITENNAVLVPIALLTMVPLWKNPATRRLLIIGCGLPIAQAFLAPQFRHHGRYFFPILPLLLIAGVWAIFYWWQQRGQTYPKLVRLAVVLAILAALASTTRWLFIESYDVRNINDQHLAIAHTLHEYMQPNDRLAVDDVGAIAYLTDLPLIDLTGLVSPEIYRVHTSQDHVWQTARAEGATLFLIFNRLNPTLYEHYKDSLELLRSYHVRRPLSSSADSIMNLYRVRNAN